MKLVSATLALFFLVIAFLPAQNNSIKVVKQDVVFLNSKLIDPVRYEKYNGSPYWFKEFRPARVISNRFDVVDDIFINFNGDTREVEVRKGDDEFVELARSYYARIELVPKKGEGDEPLVFQRGFHPSFGDKFMQVLYRSDDIILAKEFYVNVVEPHIETIHGSMVKYRFARTESLHLCVDGNCRPIVRKQFPILKMFKQSPAIKNYFKEYKPKLKNDEEIIKLIKFYETEVMGKG